MSTKPHPGRSGADADEEEARNFRVTAIASRRAVISLAERWSGVGWVGMEWSSSTPAQSIASDTTDLTGGWPRGNWLLDSLTPLTHASRVVSTGRQAKLARSVRPTDRQPAWRRTRLVRTRKSVLAGRGLLLVEG